MIRIKKDLTGQRFSKLVVIEKSTKLKGFVRWKCKCDCGNIVIVNQTNLLSGTTKSCGCFKLEKVSMIGKSTIRKTQEFNKENCLKDGTNISILTQKVKVTNKSGYKGVSWNKQNKKWMASITFQKKSHYLGLYDKIEDAVKARQRAEEEYFKPVIEKYKNIKKEI